MKAVITLLLVPVLSSCLRTGPFIPGGSSSVPSDATNAPDSNRAADGRDAAQGSGDVQPPVFGHGTWSLGTPELVSELNSTYDEADLFLTNDGKTAYLSSTRPGGPNGYDIYTATRSGPSQPFSTPVNLTGINSSSFEAFASTADGLVGFLTTNRAGGPGNADVWMGTRSSTAVAWQNSLFTPNLPLSSAANDYDAVPSLDGLRVYYASSAGGGGTLHVVVAERSSRSSSFGSPSVISELSLGHASTDSDPTLSPNELVIVFTSDRAGGSGGMDLWYAVRSSRSAPFSTPKPLPTVNSTNNDTEAFITADGLELYFSSDRPGGQGLTDLYRVSILQGP